MIGDAFVFDGVAHPFNFTEKNMFGPQSQMFVNHLYAFHAALTPDERDPSVVGGVPQGMDPGRHPADGLRAVRHRHARRDAAPADRLLPRRPVTVGDLRATWPQRDPDRTVFWGSVNPLEGRGALDLMERQVREFGAKAFKFYNVRYDYGSPFPWRMDDPQIAFPVFEKAQELGVNLIGVHKGLPLGPQPVEATQTWDMDGAAANFPDINFVIFHVGLPFLDETCWQLIRLPQPVRLTGRDDQLRRAGAARVRGDPRQAAVLGRRGQDRLRFRGADLPPAVGAAGVQGLLRSRRTSARDTATRSSPTRPSGRSSARTCCGCTAWTSRPRRHVWAARSRTERRSGRPVGRPGQDGGDRGRRISPRGRRPGAVSGRGTRPRSVPRTSAARRSAPRRSAEPRSAPRRSAPIR